MKKNTWIYYVIAGLVIIAGVGAAVFFGAKPKSLPKISYSHFESPEDFGANIYKRLRLEINSHTLIFLGVQTDQPEHLAIWKGLLDSIEPENKFAYIITDKSLGENTVISSNESISMQENPQQVIEGIKKILSDAKRVIIIAPTSFLSYMINTNFQTSLREALYGKDQKVFDVPWLTFSLSSFATSKEEESAIAFPCNTTPHDLDGSSELGCLIQLKSRTIYRKKKVPGKYPGMLDQIGTKEYLALFAKKTAP